MEQPTDPWSVPFVRQASEQARAAPPRRRVARMRQPEVPLQKNRRAIDWLAVVRGTMAVLVILQFLHVLFFSPRLGLVRIEIEGTGRLTPEKVLALGEIERGQNLFRIGLSRLSKQLGREPYLQEAIVTRKLPDGLGVIAKERVPAYQVTAPGMRPGTARIADPGGMVFDRADRLRADLPLVEVPLGKLPQVGSLLEPEVLDLARECTRLGEAERVDVRRVRVDSRGELWLNIVSPPGDGNEGASLLVRVGRGTELPEKFRDVRLTLQGWPDLPETAEYLNVMCPGRPAMKRLAEEGSTP